MFKNVDWNKEYKNNSYKNPECLIPNTKIYKFYHFNQTYNFCKGKIFALSACAQNQNGAVRRFSE